jgi:uncharacterized membrane protein YbhN (UPF0104 family)
MRLEANRAVGAVLMALGKFRSARPLEIAVSAAVIAAMFLFVDMGKVVGIILGANLWFFGLAILAYLGTVFAMAYRIRFVLGHLGRKISFWEAFRANWGGLAAADYTPARAGYFVTPFLLEKKSGVALEKGMAAVLGPQIVEFFFKAVGAAAGIMLIVYSSPLAPQNAAFLWAGVALMLAFCMLMWVALFVPAFVLHARRLSFLPFVGEGCDFIVVMQANRGKLGEIFPQIILISVFTVFTKALEWYFFGMAIGISMSTSIPVFLVYMVLQPLVTVFQFVPAPIIAGIGISEAGAVAALGMLGVGAELAVAYSLLVRFGTMIVNVGGVFSLVDFFFPSGGKKEG